jgi:hypothetical protein
MSLVSSLLDDGVAVNSATELTLDRLLTLDPAWRCTLTRCLDNS